MKQSKLQDPVTRDNRKSWPKFVAVLIAALFAGGALGTAVTWIMENPSLDEVIRHLGVALGACAPWIVLCALLFWAGSMVCYRRGKAAFASWDGEDEDALEVCEQRADSDQQRILLRIVCEVVGNHHCLFHVALAHCLRQLVVVEVLADAYVLFDMVGGYGLCPFRKIGQQLRQFVRDLCYVHAEVVYEHLQRFGVYRTAFGADELTEPRAYLVVARAYRFECHAFGRDVLVELRAFVHVLLLVADDQYRARRW